MFSCDDTYDSDADAAAYRGDELRVNPNSGVGLSDVCVDFPDQTLTGDGIAAADTYASDADAAAYRGDEL